MAIVFDQVEGVVQKASGPASTAAPAKTSPPKPPAESQMEVQRRMEERARRLHAD